MSWNCGQSQEKLFFSLFFFFNILLIAGKWLLEGSTQIYIWFLACKYWFNICWVTFCTLLKIDFRFVWKFTANFQPEWWFFLIKHADCNYRHEFAQPWSTFFLMSREVNIPFMETQLFSHSILKCSLTRVFREELPIPAWSPLSGTGNVGPSLVLGRFWPSRICPSGGNAGACCGPNFMNSKCCSYALV